VTSKQPLVPRPDLRGAFADDWDERVVDLHYADTPEYAVGHGISTQWELIDGVCHTVRTAWIPSAEVERTETVTLPDVELSMDALGGLRMGTRCVARCCRLPVSTGTGSSAAGP